MTQNSIASGDKYYFDTKYYFGYAGFMHLSEISWSLKRRYTKIIQLIQTLIKTFSGFCKIY